MRPLRLLILAVALPASPALAQSPVTSLRFQPYPAYLGRGPTRVPPMTADSDSVGKQLPKTYWKEGALIGGGAAGILGGFMGYGFCGMSETSHSSCALQALGGAVIVGMMGAVLGGFTGSFIEKK